MKTKTMTARSLHIVSRRTLAAALLGLIAVVSYAPAQSRWTIDPKSSLVWWQMRPHLNHLWATTCPEEPSWRPGDGRSGGSWTSTQGFRAARGSEGYGAAATGDTLHIPLWPRHRIRAVCNPEAVRGNFVVSDAATLRGLRGEVVVDADALTTANNDRDSYARSAILQTTRYQEIRFVFDSVVAVTQRADTMRGTAVGSLTIRDVTKPMTAGFRAYPVPGGMRVFTKFSTPAQDLVPEWGLSRFALGLGVGVRIWEELYMGADLVVRPEE